MSEPKFKKGDRVRAVHNLPGCFTKGEEYIVEDYGPYGHVRIAGRYNDGTRPGNGVMESNFELVSGAAGPAAKPMILPEDPKVRKGMPITTGVVDYFPLALAEVAVVSKAGNDQHNPGQPLHWEKGLSTDHADCIMRHLIDRGARDTDGMRHSAKLAWRALALLQTELEAEAAAKA